jgi:hypothetical protein
MEASRVCRLLYCSAVYIHIARKTCEWQWGKLRPVDDGNNDYSSPEMVVDGAPVVTSAGYMRANWKIPLPYIYRSFAFFRRLNFMAFAFRDYAKNMYENVRNEALWDYYMPSQIWVTKYSIYRVGLNCESEIRAINLAFSHSAVGFTVRQMRAWTVFSIFSFLFFGWILANTVTSFCWPVMSFFFVLVVVRLSLPLNHRRNTL